MKEYRLLAWPDLRLGDMRIRHRRALTEMSQRFAGVARLAEVSGLKKSEVRALIDILDEHAALTERETSEPDSIFDALSPLGWLRRAIHPSHDRR